MFFIEEKRSIDLLDGKYCVQRELEENGKKMFFFNLWIFKNRRENGNQPMENLLDTCKKNAKNVLLTFIVEEKCW